MEKSIKQFTIYKAGTTTKGPVTIVSPVGQVYDKSAKMAFYRSLGYEVKEITKKPTI